MPRSDYRFAHRLRIRWAECDKQGIVFNGHYLTYADVGLTEYLRAIGIPSPVWNVVPDVELYAVRSVIDYHAPAEFDDVLDVAVRVARMGRSSLRFLIELHRVEPGEPAHLTTIELVYCTASPATRKSVPIPAMLRDRILAWDGDSVEDAGDAATSGPGGRSAPVATAP